MVMLNVGINRIRDLLDADVFKCQAGTDNTASNQTQTGLISAVAETLVEPTTVTAHRTVNITHAIGTTLGNGSTLTEQETQVNSGSTSLNRVVYTGIDKTASKQLTYITTIYFDTPTS